MSGEARSMAAGTRTGAVIGVRLLKRLGLIAGIGGALIVALNLPWSGLGFVVFLVSSLAWSAAAAAMREWELLILSLAYTAVNLLGIYRWLIA